jgi:hypothetical protein
MKHNLDDYIKNDETGEHVARMGKVRKRIYKLGANLKRGDHWRD